MKKTGVLMIGIVFFLISGTGAYGVSEIKADGKGLFEKQCGLCHNLDRPKSKLKTAKEWEATVMRMKDTRGAKITDDEAKSIIDYLSKNYGKQ